MQLSLHADYSLRVLLYLGTHPEETVATQQISDAYRISKNHLVRVMQTLGEAGYIDVIPGRSGGVRLAMDPKQIRLGAVVRAAEPTLELLECFNLDTNTCPILPVCGLKVPLLKALEAFFDELNKFTLADLLTPGRKQRLVQRFIQIQEAPLTHS